MLGILLLVIGGLLLRWIFTFKRGQDYWKARGIPYKTPTELFLFSFRQFTFQKSQITMYEEWYNQTNAPYIGYYEMTPAILLRDPAIIGRILVKDFNNFVDHGFGNLPKSEVDSSLFLLEGDEWRAVRYKMVPTFTTGKLKGMFPQMMLCSKKLVPLIEEKQKEVDIMDVSTSYTMSVIASCAFGIEIDAKLDTEFRRMGRVVFDMTVSRFFKSVFMVIFPGIAKKLSLGFTPSNAAQFFSKIIKDTFKYRKENNIVRNDFVQMLLQLKEKGSVEVQSRDKEDEYLESESIANVKNIEMTDQLLISQAFTFLTAGFEGMTINIMFTLYELSLNEEIQNRARNEIENIMNKHGVLNYEALKEATFLSSCLDESLRKYPLAPLIFRSCTKRYEIEEGVFIEPGTKVVIPLPALHKDSAYWQQPDKFDPDRFTRDPMVPHTYIPFGDGPRMCIGMRFALLEIKLGLAVILYNFRVKLNPKTKLPFQTDVRSFFIKPKDPIYFDFEKIQR